MPVLTDGTVILRAHADDDVEAIVEQCTDPQSLRWTAVPRGYTVEDARAFVEHIRSEWTLPDGIRYWAIEWLDGDRPRFGGTIDLRPGESPLTASVGFGLHPGARGRGAMVRAVRLVAQHAFDQGPWGRPLARIHWRAIAGNWGSRRVARATGFTFHGTVPDSLFDPTDRTGSVLDAWIGSLAASDEQRPRAPWHVAPVLEGAAVRLRPWRDDDGLALPDQRPDDPGHWVPEGASLTRSGFDAWVMRKRLLSADGHGVDWCIADAATDRALGSVALFSQGGPLIGDDAELGYQVVPEGRGRGVAAEAARLALRHGMAPRDEDGLGLRRVVAITAADNVASSRVLERTGFREFGREHAVDPLPGGGFADVVHWELISRT